MNPLLRRSLFILLLICPYVLVFGVIISTRPGDLFYTGIRFCGLFGFVSLSLGVIMNLLKREIKTSFGQPFMRIHHIFVLSGLVLITVHPVLLAISIRDFSVFLPETSSVSVFLTNGGRVAIILIYIGFLAAIFRSILKGRWIQIHRIMYLALVLGFVHANLLGQDLSNPIIRILSIVMVGTIIITGIVKMRQRHRLSA